MSPKRKAARRAGHSGQRPASDTPCPTDPLIEGTIKLAGALFTHITSGCSPRDEFYSIMGPAQDLVCLVPRDWTTCSPALRSYIFNSHVSNVGLLLTALAWSAPAVVPGRTPYGMDVLEAPRVWGEVADHCCKMVGTALPALPQGTAHLQGLMEAAQMAGLPGALT